MLKSRDCSAVLTKMGDDVEKQWLYFKSLYAEIVQKYVPTRKLRQTVGPDGSAKHRQAIDRRILRTVKRKHRVWQRYMETRDGKKYEKYKKKEIN